jgi:pimeloyl-ACP methyl ester carboxylesterase
VLACLGSLPSRLIPNAAAPASREKLKIPVLFFGGETSLGNAFEDYLGQVATNATTVVVPDSGHWMPEENPAFVVEKLTSFMS